MSEALQAWIAATPMFVFLATGLVCAGFAAQAFFAIHLGLSLAWMVYMAFSFGLDSLIALLLLDFELGDFLQSV
jgi:hypothetical protein